MRSVPRFCLLSAVLFLSLFFTCNSDSISEYASDTLLLCAVSVIPSLFPFMVLSSLAAKTASFLTDGTPSPISTLIPIFLGALCGFPVGAATVASMYQNGALTKEKAEYLSALCNNTGPAYLVSVVGTLFWGNASIGILFYVCQIASAFTVFGIHRIFCIFTQKRKSSVSNMFIRRNEDHTHRNLTAEKLCRNFCTSVTDSAVSVIKICGYIVFFRVICDSFLIVLPESDISRYIYTLLSCILEFTSGARASAELGGIVGILLCGFTIGFSGLSVIAQSAGILSSAGLSPYPLLKMKFFSGIVSACLSATLYSFFDIPKPVFMLRQSSHLHFTSRISLLILFLALIIAVIYKTVRKKILPKS